MNTFVNRFAATNALAGLEHARDGEEEVNYTMWGSEGGFGNLTKGGPTFNLPAVPDVCSIPTDIFLL